MHAVNDTPKSPVNPGIPPLIDYFSEPLSAQSLAFLDAICEKNPLALKKLPEKLKRNAAQLKTQLKAYHVDQAIEALYQQMNLPHDLIHIINTHLKHHPGSIMNTTLSPYDCNINTQTHILKVMEHLNLLNQTHDHVSFIRTMVHMLLNQPDIDAEPQHRAHEAMQRLAHNFQLEPNTPMYAGVAFIINRILVLGTTLIHGPTRAMDLSELFFIVEEVASNAGFSVMHPSNAGLIQELNAIMLTVGLCHKKPIALYDLVVRETTLNTLKQHIKTPLVLDDFFMNHAFHDYFAEQKTSNHNAFLLSFTAHFKRALKANRDQDIIVFMTTCHHALRHEALFMDWFENACHHNDLIHRMQALFFSSLEHHITFSLSQVGSLVFVANKLISMGHPPRAATVAKTGCFQPLITPNVSLTDAKNLKAFELFFRTLSLASQDKLFKELILFMILTDQTKSGANESTSRCQNLLET